MAGLIFVSPGGFTDPGDLPQVPPSPVLPIRGAMIDWAADRLPTGALASWTDMLGANTLAAPAQPHQHPVVVGGGRGRSVTFDGSGQRLDATMGLTGPLTMVVVAKSATGEAGDYLFGSGAAANPTWNLGVSPGDRWMFTTGSGSSIIPLATADTNWHIFIVNVDGANSVMSIDGDETTGAISSSATWDAIRIGASVSNYYGVELRRLAVIPRATTGPERQKLQQELSTHYGI